MKKMVDCYVLVCYKAYSGVIRGWIRQCMKWLENWWLSCAEIRVVTFPYMLPPFSHMFHVSPIVSQVSLDICYVSLDVSPFPILGLTIKNCNYWILLQINSHSWAYTFFVNVFSWSDKYKQYSNINVDSFILFCVVVLVFVVCLFNWFQAKCMYQGRDILTSYYFYFESPYQE